MLLKRSLYASVYYIICQASGGRDNIFLAHKDLWNVFHADEVATLHLDRIHFFLTHSCTGGYKFSSLRSTDVPLSTCITLSSPILKYVCRVKVMQVGGKAKESLFIQPCYNVFDSFCPPSRCLFLISYLTSSVHSYGNILSLSALRLCVVSLYEAFREEECSFSSHYY